MSSLMKLWLRGHLRTFGQGQIRSSLFLQVLKRHVFEVGEGVAYGPYSMSARADRSRSGFYLS